MIRVLVAGGHLSPSLILALQEQFRRDTGEDLEIGHAANDSPECHFSGENSPDGEDSPEIPCTFEESSPRSGHSLRLNNSPEVECSTHLNNSGENPPRRLSRMEMLRLASMMTPSLGDRHNAGNIREIPSPIDVSIKAEVLYVREKQKFPRPPRFLQKGRRR